MKALGIPAEVIDMKDYDPDDRLADEVSGEGVPREDALSFHPFDRNEQNQQAEAYGRPCEQRRVLK